MIGVVMSEKIFKDIFSSFCEDNKLYQTITEISKSDENPAESVVINDFKVWSMDNLCQIIHEKLKKTDENHAKHSSTDGFYFFEDDSQLKLLLIEFKHINSKSRRKKTKNRILKQSLKLKPLETLSCIIPYIV